MDWMKQLSRYEGSPIEIWIEDRSGEEQTQPKHCTLFKVQQSDDKAYMQFFLNSTQFLSVPIFGGILTQVEQSDSKPYFVSHDLHAKLVYWVYFEK